MQRIIPLTHPQKRIFFIEKIYPNQALHNIGGVIRIKGSIEVGRLEKAIQKFIQKNEGTRNRIYEQNNEVYQHIGYYNVPSIEYIDFSQFVDAELQFKEWVERESSKPFPLENENLFYIAIFRISPNETGYFTKFHHIIADGWSLQLLTDQIYANYEENSEECTHIEKIECSYIDFYEREKKYLASRRYDKDKEFWEGKLKDLPEAFLKKSSDDLTGNRETFKLDVAFSAWIREFVQKNNITMNIFFVSVFLIYLHKTLQSEDVIIGTPVFNRSGKREKNIFGMFTSSMPFRTAINGEDSFSDLIRRLQTEMNNYFVHQKYPYDLLVHDLDLKKKGYDNLFNLCVNYYNTTHPKLIDGIAVENYEFYNGTQLYALQLVIKDWDDSGALTLDFDYKTKDYSRQEIIQMYEHIKHLMNELTAKPAAALQQIPILSEEESQQLLLRFNDTFADYLKDRTVFQIIEVQASKTPDKVAILFGQRSVTYFELNQKANQMARNLRKKGITRGDIVGVMMNPSAEMVISILGLMKAGAAYLPIDTSYPEERISYIIRDSGISLLIVDGFDLSFYFPGEVISILDQDIFSGSTSDLGESSDPDDLAYVMYTSGSTGNPKGVMVKHQGLLNYLCWAEKTYIKSELEIFPLYSSLSFDLTVTSLFTPLISGHQIVIYQQDQSEFILFKILRENLATIIKLTPAHLSLIKHYDCRNSSVKRFIVGGEDLKVDLARCIYENFDGDIEIYNEYGPTETVVGCTVHKYNYQLDNGISVPIGVPADNVHLYVLDPLLNPLPIYSVGELYISGDGVAAGYLNKPEITAEKFIDNPFIKGKMMYRTGDYVRFIDGGVLEYKGRVDHQVKLRGYRIELGEIEQNLMRIEGIRDAVVILYEKSSNKHLCAYITVSQQISETEIRRKLGSAVPSYMVPDYIVHLEQMPLDHNGKINRSHLPDPEMSAEVGDECTAVSEETIVLIRILKEILQLALIRPNQNFYHLGGDSIKAIQVSAKLLEEGYRLFVKDILANPLISNMAMLVRKEDRITSESEPCTGEVKHTPITTWFFSQQFENPNHYNQSVVLKLHVKISLDKLNEILTYLVDYHDALRFNYDKEENILYYQNNYLTSFKMDMDHLGIERFELMPEIGGKLKASLDISNGILFKAAPFESETGDMYLLLIAHHLIIDGVSWRILLEDLSLLINQSVNDMDLSLPVKTTSYQEWARTLYENRNILNEVERKYLMKIGAGAPLYKKCGNTCTDTVKHAKTVSFMLSEEYTQSLLTTANHTFNTHANELMIMGLALAVQDTFHRSDIILEIEGHGREMLNEKVDLSRTVGWFTTMYPLILKADEEVALSEILKEWKEQLRAVPMNGVWFGMSQYHSGSLMNKVTQRPEIRFNYMGEFDTAFKSEYFDWSNIWSGPDIDLKNHVTAEMDIVAMVVQNRLRFDLTYNGPQYSEDFVMELVHNFEKRLKEINDYCHQITYVNYTPSDFDAAEITQEELDSLFL